MQRDAALFGFWLALLGTCLHLGPLVRHWFEGASAVWAGGFLLLSAALAAVWAGGRIRRLAPQRRLPAALFLAFTALGLALLAWLQPMLIERTHLLLYGVLGVLAWRLLAHWRRGGPRLLGAVLLAALVGLLDELGQGLHPERMFDWRDVGTNAAAAALTALAAWRLRIAA
ncbi:hypothetical protein AAU61_05050 [Desulfocarbo indianensis]|nr:hypothetical protein AAU61_05050 [Desulfocarbo indianensis]